MSTPLYDNDDDRFLAAEHALGVLDGARLTEAVRRSAEDPEFRAEVEGWAAHLAPLLAEYSEAAVSPRVWISIVTRIDAEHGMAVAQPRRKARVGPWRDVRVWRGATAGALALAAASWAVMLAPSSEAVVPPPAQPPGLTPVLAASLAPERGPALFTVMVDRDRGQVAVVPLHAWAPDRARQLWLIPADGVPRSLGLIEHDAPTPLVLSPVMRRQAQATVTFAVSDEPLGGSPLPGPSGAVLATGALVAL